MAAVADSGCRAGSFEAIRAAAVRKAPPIVYGYKGRGSSRRRQELPLMVQSARAATGLDHEMETAFRVSCRNGTLDAAGFARSLGIDALVVSMDGGLLMRRSWLVSAVWIWQGSSLQSRERTALVPYPLRTPKPQLLSSGFCLAR